MCVCVLAGTNIDVNFRLTSTLSSTGRSTGSSPTQAGGRVTGALLEHKHAHPSAHTHTHTHTRTTHAHKRKYSNTPYYTIPDTNTQTRKHKRTHTQVHAYTHPQCHGQAAREIRERRRLEKIEEEARKYKISRGNKLGNDAEGRYIPQVSTINEVFFLLQ